MSFFTESQVSAIQSMATTDKLVANVWAQFISNDRFNSRSEDLEKALGVLVSKGAIDEATKSKIIDQ